MKLKNKYSHKKIEAKWQSKWETEATNYPKQISKTEKKFYNLWMFPYPSAEGLHAGHAFASTGSDAYGRYKRMNGYEVFQPIGYDSFGIHSENFAIKTGRQPRELIEKTTLNYARQLKSLGHGYDWTHTVTTSDLSYYKWTQWLFVEMFKAGLAYRAEAEVNWCPSCKTVLADEQAVSPKQAGKLPSQFKKLEDVPEGILVCERCATIIQKKKLKQWFFKIQDYADRLLENLGKIDWPEKIKVAQSNWIGKKEGINISYRVENSNEVISCWTSRPETNFGATFIVLSPKNPLIEKITTRECHSEVEEYLSKVLNKGSSVVKKKTGVFTGSYAINSLNNQKLPIWISDFVLMEFGTGAVVGVPGQDKRDFEFAKKFKIPVKRVIEKNGDGKIINSEFLNGLDINTARYKIIEHLTNKGWGTKKTHYHLRDWLISRQRYWGPPIPMIYCNRCAQNGRSWFTTGSNAKNLAKAKHSNWQSAGWYPEENLPVELPNITDYLPKGTGRGPLNDHPEFFKAICPGCGADAVRETDVSDTFLDSSWYFLRYPSADSNKYAFDPHLTKLMLPVDLYFGGAEHAVLHLMYARFVNQVLHDLGYITFDEPFPKFFAHGLMIKDGAKMSKSRGNVINPDQYIHKYGADTLRLYLMFMGPMDGYPDFRDTGIEGMYRFVQRLWDLFNTNNVNLRDEKVSLINIKMHQTIKNVTEDFEKFRYNTAIASIMEYSNVLRETLLNNQNGKKENKEAWQNALNVLAKLIAPFAPHMAEEVWTEILGNKFSIHRSAWPKHDSKFTNERNKTVAVQVNGKLRATLLLEEAKANTESEVKKAALKTDKINNYISDKKLIRTVFVPGKVINFVTRG